MNILCTVVLICLALLIIYKYINRNHGYWRKKGVFSLKPLPIIGNFKDVLNGKYQVGEWFRWLYEQGKGKPYIGAYLFGTPILVLRDPKIIKDVLQKDFSHFENRTATAPDHDKVMKSMLLFAKNPLWKTLRQKVTPTYTSGKLKAMFPAIRDVGEILKKYLKNNIPHEEMDARELASKYSFEVILKTAFAVDGGCFQSEDSEFRKYAKKTQEPRFIPQIITFFAPAIAKYLRVSFINVEARKFFEEVFKKTMILREKVGAQGNDFVDILVTLKKNDTTGVWDSDTLLGQSLQIFFAGTETTAQAISYTLHELALQPDIQEKLRNELKSMLEENDGQIAYETLLNQKYLDMCVSETFRKYPALPFLDRLCNTDYKVESTGLIIEKGTQVYIPLMGIEYDAQHFPNPQKYDPERFRDMSEINKEGLYYMPFGEGPRVCIGERFGVMSVKLALTHILTNFEVEPTKNTKLQPELIKRFIFTVPEGGLPLKFKMLK